MSGLDEDVAEYPGSDDHFGY